MSSRPDSLTTIINDVVEKHALKAGDIRKLYPGETIKVIIFDRNIGDYLHGTKAGTVFNTREYLEDNHLAHYRHNIQGGLSGELYLDAAGQALHTEWAGKPGAPWVPLRCCGQSLKSCENGWTWEINRPRPDLYWGPIPKRVGEISDNTKVGWRGPAILYENIADMPETFVHYGTSADDYFAVRTLDLSSIETINILSQRDASREFSR